MPGKQVVLNRFHFVVALTVLLVTGMTLRLAPAFADEKTPTKDTKPAEKTAEEKTDLIEKNPFPNRPKAPSLDGGKEWLNSSGEITLKDLRGKVVLIDFWTYCCIN